MPKNEKENNKKKIIAPIVISTVILSGVGGGTYIHHKLKDETVEETSNKANQEKPKQDDEVNNEKDKDENDSKTEDDDIELDYEKDDEGNISFIPKENEEDEGYAHLKEIAESEAKGENEHYVSKDEDGNLSFNDKNDEDDRNLVADKDGNIDLPSDNEDNSSEDGSANPDDGNSDGEDNVDTPTEPGEPNPEQPEEPVDPDPNPEQPEEPVDPDPNPEQPEEPGDPKPEPEEPEEPVDPEPEPEEPDYPDTDKESMQELIDLAESLDEEHYTERSWDRLQRALERAKEINEDKWASQWRINVVTNRLNTAINRLDFVAPNIEVTGFDNVDEDGVTRYKELNLVINGKDYKGDSSDVEVVFNHFTKVEGVDGEYSFDLKAGKNTIKVTVTDELGKRTTETFNVTYDDSLIPIQPPPQVDIEGLTNGPSEDKEIIFTVKAEDESGQTIEPTVTHNDQLIEGDGEMYHVNLMDGENIIVIKAESEDGIISTRTFTVIYEEPSNEDNNDGNLDDNNPENNNSQDDTIKKVENGIDHDETDKSSVNEKNEETDVVNVEEVEEAVEAVEEIKEVTNEEVKKEPEEEMVQEVAEEIVQDTNQEVDKESGEEVVAEIEETIEVISGQIANSNKEHDTREAAESWAEQLVNEKLEKEKGHVIWIVNPIQYGNPLTGEVTSTTYTVEWLSGM